MTEDKLQTIHGSTIQHGPHNNRVYLMKLNKNNVSSTLSDIEKIAGTNHYGKIFAKVPASSSVVFQLKGYVMEAYIPGYYNGQEDAFFLSRFLTEDRKHLPREDLSVLQNILTKQKNLPEKKEHPIKNMKPEETDVMAELYKRVFPTYPFPIHDPGYLQKTMEDHISYFGLYENKKLIALSSAEKDTYNRAVEMTDFAVLPEYRGNNISYYLLEKMEKEMKKEGYRTFYTIARLKAPGMNLTFLKKGYQYSGTLINNTNISGQIESMNVLYKNAVSDLF